jgi:hypothetical protein
MAMLNGLGCTITDKTCLTFGKPGVIEYFDTKATPITPVKGKQGQWYVTFDAGWCGWYNRSQFTVDRRT